MTKLRYADDLPYWKTGRSKVAALDEAINAIKKAGGKIRAQGQFTEEGGTGAFFVQFEMDGDQFRFVEPIMQTRGRTQTAMNAAEVQACASLKHSIKARVNEALRHGARRAFLAHLLLPDGSVASQRNDSELARLFAPYDNLLSSGDVVDGEIE